MLIRVPKSSDLDESQVTPEPVYRARRDFIGRSLLGLAGLALADCSRAGPASGANSLDSTDPQALRPLPVASRRDMAGGESVTPIADSTGYNNFYEFGTDKEDPAANAGTLKTRPWHVEVGGECDAPATVAIDDLIPFQRVEERIYRHRCVEAWSMVVPWVGVPLADLLQRFKPNSKAKYVAFRTLYDPAQMPRARRVLPWPYREGLRIDEAMHPLAFVSVGMYGRVLPNQNGAPLRLTVPWKYGFKSIKSLVAIRFVETMPQTTWNTVAPDEYGFYANVNPNVPHPRWSQATERRLGEFFRRKTLMFNGYPDVAPLYAGMDLHRWF